MKRTKINDVETILFDPIEFIEYLLALSNSLNQTLLFYELCTTALFTDYLQNPFIKN